MFGCKAFAHVPKEQRTNLDDKSVPCIFIGYGDEEFGYKLWDLVKKKVIRSRDVIFRESEVRNADDLSEKAKKKNGIVPNLVTVPSFSNHPISAESMIDEGVEHEEQPDEIVEQGEQLGDNTEQMEYPEEEQSQPLRRSERRRIKSTKYPSSEYVLINDEGELESLKEVLSHPEKIQWMKDIHEEMGSL